MTIDLLLQSVTIEFKEALTLEETEKLLDYIAENLPADITSKITYHYCRYHNSENREIKRERGTVYIGGSIRNITKHSFDSFETLCSKDTSKIKSIRFQTI